MSMVSSLCDRLEKLATACQDTPEEQHLREYGNAMEEAADTIRLLRDVGIENMRLRELVADFCNAPCTYCGSCSIRATCKLKRRAAGLTNDGAA